nr:addiction module antidote protein [Bradyrhizobium sp. 61]
MNQAFASAEPHRICGAIGEALKDFNISEISREAGLQRTSIYRAFGNEQLPNFSTVLAVLTAMGLQLKVTPKRGAHKRALIQPDPLG